AATDGHEVRERLVGEDDGARVLRAREISPRKERGEIAVAGGIDGRDVVHDGASEPGIERATVARRERGERDRRRQREAGARRRRPRGGRASSVGGASATGLPSSLCLCRRRLRNRPRRRRSYTSE